MTRTLNRSHPAGLDARPYLEPPAPRPRWEWQARRRPALRKRPPSRVGWDAQHRKAVQKARTVLRCECAPMRLLASTDLHAMLVEPGPDGDRLELAYSLDRTMCVTPAEAIDVPPL